MTKNISYHQGRMDAIAFIRNDNIRVGLNGKPKERYKYKGKCPPEKHWVQPEKGKGFCRKSQGLHSPDQTPNKKVEKPTRNNWLGWATAGLMTVGIGAFLLSGNHSEQKDQKEKKKEELVASAPVLDNSDKDEKDNETKINESLGTFREIGDTFSVYDKHYKNAKTDAEKQLINELIDEAITDLSHLNDEEKQRIKGLSGELKYNELMDNVITNLPHLTDDEKQQVKSLSGEVKYRVCQCLTFSKEYRYSLLETDSQSNSAILKDDINEITSFSEVEGRLLRLDFFKHNNIGEVKGLEGGWHEVSFSVNHDTQRDENMTEKEGFKIMRGIQRLFTSARKYITEDSVLFSLAESRDGHANSRINVYKAFNFQEVNKVKMNTNHEKNKEGKIIPLYSPLLMTINKVKGRNKMVGLTPEEEQSVLNHLRSREKQINTSREITEIIFDAYLLGRLDAIAFIHNDKMSDKPERKKKKI